MANDSHIYDPDKPLSFTNWPKCKPITYCGDLQVMSTELNFKTALLAESIAKPAGITSLAKAVGCSTPTARKHLMSMANEGSIQLWIGGRGNVFGDPNNASNSDPRDMQLATDPVKPSNGHVFIARGTIKGKRCRISVTVSKSTKTGNKIIVVTTNPLLMKISKGEIIMKWNSSYGGWTTRLPGGGSLAVRPK